MSNEEMDKMIADYKNKNLKQLRESNNSFPSLTPATRRGKRRGKALSRISKISKLYR